MIFLMDGVGEILVEHSARALRVSITVRPWRVRVAVPAGIPLSRGRDLALEKEAWIRSHIDRMRSLARARASTAGSLPPLEDPTAARERIVGRLEELSKLYGFPYARVTVRNQKTRWGSCSVRGAISLNINLARLPEELMDYVILHELVHTRIRGHGSEFWSRLDMLVSDARSLRRALRQYSTELG